MWIRQPDQGKHRRGMSLGLSSERQRGVKLVSTFTVSPWPSRGTCKPSETLTVQMTFPRLMLEHAAQRPAAAALREKEFGIWQTTTWGALATLVRELACGLAAAGLRRGQHIVVVGE